MSNVESLTLHKHLKDSGLSLRQLVYATENYFFIQDESIVRMYEHFYLRYWDCSYVSDWLKENDGTTKIVWYRSSPSDLAKHKKCRVSFRIFPDWMNLAPVILIQVLKSQVDFNE